MWLSYVLGEQDDPLSDFNELTEWLKSSIWVNGDWCCALEGLSWGVYEWF